MDIRLKKYIPIWRGSVRGRDKKLKKKVPTSLMNGSILGSLVGAKTESILLPHSTPTQGYSK